MTRRFSPRIRRADGRSDGFVLIAVLWILTALAGLFGAYVAYALTMAQSADFYLRRVGAEAALTGALELAVYDLSRMDPQRRPSEGILDYRIGEAHVRVRYAAESLRLDLNKASLESLTFLFADAGAGGAYADRYAQRILGWREKPGGQGAGMEDLSYRAAGAPYMPRHGPFQSVEELWDVREIPPDVIARIAPLVTVYGGRAKWREDEQDQTRPGASPPGRTSSALSPAQNARADSGAQGALNAAQALGGSQEGEQTLKPTRLEIRAMDAQSRAVAAETVVIGTRDGDGPYNVLLWRTGDELATPRDGRRR